MAWIVASPSDAGHLRLVVRRPGEDEREILAEGHLSGSEGLAGDSWHTRTSTSGPDGRADPEMQLTLMNSRVAAAVAGANERWALAGDQLFVDFDLSVANCPPGTRLSIGGAVVALTAPPHTGCHKFVARFGKEAMRFVNSPTGRSLRLRGAHARVVTAGTVRPGDEVVKLREQPGA